jgi:uncharacterized protein
VIPKNPVWLIGHEKNSYFCWPGIALFALAGTNLTEINQMNTRPAFSNMHSFTRLVMLVGLMIVSLLVVLVLGTLAAYPFWSDQIMSLAGGEPLAVLPENLNVLRYFQVMSHLGLFVVPSLAFAWIISKRPLLYLSAGSGPSLRSLLLALLIVVSALPLVSLLNQLNHQISLPEALEPFENWMRQAEAAAEQMTEFFVLTGSWQDLLLNLFMIAILPAIGEELLFRGILQKIFRRWTGNGHAAVFITALLFSAMHMQFLSFLPRFALGIVLGYLFLWSGKIWVPIFAHFFNNAAALVVYFLFHRGVFPYDMDEVGMSLAGSFLALAGTVVMVGLFYFFRRMEYSQKPGKESLREAIPDEGGH